MISDEAVEAAAKAEFPDWETVSEEWWRDAVRERLRTTLEAAAPHMLAGAWDVGWEAGLHFTPNDTNPYRIQD